MLATYIRFLEYFINFLVRSVDFTGNVVRRRVQRLRLHANKRFVKATEAADKNADHSNYVSTIGLCAFNEHANVDDVLALSPSFPQRNYCGLGRDFITQKINSMINHSTTLFVKTTLYGFFFVIIFFLLRPLALLFKSAIAISFYLIIAVHTISPHVFRMFPCMKIQYFIIIKKKKI